MFALAAFVPARSSARKFNTVRNRVCFGQALFFFRSGGMCSGTDGHVRSYGVGCDLCRLGGAARSGEGGALGLSGMRFGGVRFDGARKNVLALA